METNNFISYLQSKDLSKSTQNYYGYNVTRFLSWYKNDPVGCRKKDILQYLDYLQNTLNLQNITRRNHLIALDHYFSFLQRPNVTAFIELQGTKKHRLPYIFTPQELQELYDNYYSEFIQNAPPESNPINHWRNYIMLGFLVYQGLKTTELDDLFISHINLQKAQISIEPSGRKGNARTLTLEACQIGCLMHYLNTIRPKFTKDTECQKLFIPLSQLRHRGANDSLSIAVTLRYLSKNLKTLHKDFTKLVQLRTSVITHWIKQKGLRKAQYLARHKSIVSTEEYLQNDLEALTEELSNYNPF